VQCAMMHRCKDAMQIQGFSFNLAVD
jgi:hypothetical protein